MVNREIENGDYKQFSAFLERQCGIVLGENKQYLVKSRLAPLARQHSFDSVTTLINKVVNGMDRQLRAQVVDAMTTNETLWFRDIYPFDLLRNELFAKFAANRKQLRIWSAACSSGQEPYSIAMSLLEFQKTKPGTFGGGVQIIGTDISADMLGRCEAARYDSLALSRGLSEQRRNEFFQAHVDGTYEIKPNVKKLVSFRPFNLLDSYASLGRFDIVFCRNVLIYFSAEVKMKILQQIAASLQPGGILFLGASESISGVSDLFSMVRCNPGLYYLKKD